MNVGESVIAAVLATKVMGTEIAMNKIEQRRARRGDGVETLRRGSEEGERLARSNGGGNNPIVVLPGTLSFNTFKNQSARRVCTFG